MQTKASNQHDGSPCTYLIWRRQPIRDDPVLRMAGRMRVITMATIRSLLDHRARRRVVVILLTVVRNLATLRRH